MITKWILIIVISSYGYGATSQKVEGINSKVECQEMAKDIEKQMDDFSRINYSCTPVQVVEDK